MSSYLVNVVNLSLNVVNLRVNDIEAYLVICNYHHVYVSGQVNTQHTPELDSPTVLGTHSAAFATSPPHILQGESDNPQVS